MTEQRVDSPAADLEANIEAYEQNIEELEKSYKGKYVLYYNRELIDSYDDFEAAAKDAIRRYGRGPYLIREVGLEELRLSSSLMYGIA